jgi:L-seryl-tRNA(Ser) seleniumtransferase
MHNRIRSRGRRQIPAVTRILDAVGDCDLPRPVIVDLVRRKLSEIRAQRSVPEFEPTMVLIRRSLDELRASKLQPIINGTGIIIHTNFGRAPLPRDAICKLNEIGSGYSNLEYDLATGGRGRRGSYVEGAIGLLCEAEAATIVNNCAAALVLIVRHFIATNGRLRPRASVNATAARPGALAKNEVIVSRGELVQIGGGFRIGEIIEATGARLREVGATNKTTIDDYARAIGPNTAMILKVHRSNFFMSGFVESPSTEKIGALARKKRLPFVEDLGSGAVVATEELGISDHEPTTAEVLKNGVDLVCFSGDKLFGGPQAGIIAGKTRLIAALKREPLFRALRCDKLSLAALQATVDLHLNQKTAEIAALALLQTSESELHARGAAICDELSKRCSGLHIATGRSIGKTGGGTLPKSSLPSVTIDIVPKNSSLADFGAMLRAWNPPVIGYISVDRFKLDLRTIFPHQDGLVVEAIRAACATME